MNWVSMWSDFCYGRDPFDALKISHDNLVKMGYGSWF